MCEQVRSHSNPYAGAWSRREVTCNQLTLTEIRCRYYCSNNGTQIRYVGQSCVPSLYPAMPGLWSDIAGFLTIFGYGKYVIVHFRFASKASPSLTIGLLSRIRLIQDHTVTRWYQVISGNKMRLKLRSSGVQRLTLLLVRKRLKQYFFSVPFLFQQTWQCQSEKKAGMTTVTKTNILACENREFFLGERADFYLDGVVQSKIQLLRVPESPYNLGKLPFPRCPRRALRWSISVASDASESYDWVLLWVTVFEENTLAKMTWFLAWSWDISIACIYDHKKAQFESHNGRAESQEKKLMWNKIWVECHFIKLQVFPRDILK